MNLPLPTYRRPGDITQLLEAVSMFVDKIDTAIKSLIAEPNIRFHGKNHLVRLVMFHSGLFMCEESFRDVETYLGDGADALLRDFGVDHE